MVFFLTQYCNFFIASKLGKKPYQNYIKTSNAKNGGYSRKSCQIHSYRRGFQQNLPKLLLDQADKNRKDTGGLKNITNSLDLPGVHKTIAFFNTLPPPSTLGLRCELRIQRWSLTTF